MRALAKALWPILGLCLLLALPAQAAKRGEAGVVRITTPSGKRIELCRGSHALVVGVSDYTEGWPKLDSVPAETKEVAQALRAQGFSVRMVSNPTGKQLESAFQSFINQYGFDPDNRLLFFFSGHGWSRKDGRLGYLVPADAPRPSRDLKGFKQKALSMSQVLTWCREMDSRHALFVFDACFAGTIFESRSLITPPHISDYIAKPVRYFITAGSAKEQVPARSVFVPSFVRGLRGEADLNHDGYITATELGMYLHDKVLYYRTGQTPQYGKIRDPGLDEGDFVFLVAKGTNPAPAPAKPAPKTPKPAPIKVVPNKPPAVSTGELRVDTNPSGAVIYLDGARKGRSPLILAKVAPGSHVLTASKGELHGRAELRVLPDDLQGVHIKLEGRRGDLAVASNPPGAKVSIDGQDYGRAPFVAKNLTVGPHKVSLELRRSGERMAYSGRVEVQPGSQRMRFTLKQVTGSLEVISQPSGAVVRLNGHKVGRTPLMLRGLEPGEKRLVVIKASRAVVFAYRGMILVQPGANRVKLRLRRVAARHGAARDINTREDPYGGRREAELSLPELLWLGIGAWAGAYRNQGLWARPGAARSATASPAVPGGPRPARWDRRAIIYPRR